MNKKVLLVFMLFLAPLVINAAMNPAPPFCENQGYTIEYNLEEKLSYCIFDDGKKCEIWAFYKGECGSEYTRGFPCKPLGKVVFPQFEECCEGKPYLPPMHAGQPSCQPLKTRLIGNLTYNPLYWIVGIFILILIVYIIIRKIKKK